MSLIAVSMLIVSSLFMQDALAEPDVATTLRDGWSAWMENERDAGRGITREAAAEWAAGALKGVDITTLTSGQIEEIGWIINMVPAKQEALLGHLSTLAKASTGEGLQAAVLLARQSMNSAADLDLDELLSHPGIEDAIDKGEASSLFTMLRFATPDALAEHKDTLLGYAKRLLASDKVENVMAGGGLIEGLAQDGVGLSKDERNSLFDTAAAAMKAAAERDPEDEDEMNERLLSRAKFLSGPAARGELVGGPAPNVEYLWVSDGRDEKSIRDHKGKIVVLDFWATWCGPCIGSFPNVREMQERYKGYDVEIIGVTSVQGTHYGEDGQVDVEGKPEEEFKLMQQFIGEKDITWTIAFSTEGVFNPMYGVNGIPHVAILDVDGTVVENGLHPGMDAEHKYEVIDGLLHKAGKKHPEPVKSDGPVPHDHDGDGHPDH